MLAIDFCLKRYAGLSLLMHGAYRGSMYICACVHTQKGVFTLVSVFVVCVLQKRKMTIRSKEHIYSLEMSENDCFAIANC